MTGDVADLLVGLGMTAVQRAVYGQLCRLGAAGPDELAERTGLSTALVLRVLGALQAHGLAVPVAGTTPTWAPAAPAEALENLVLDQEERVRALRAQVDELVAAHRGGSAGEVVVPIRGRQAIRERWQRLQAGARERLSLLDRPPHVQRYDPGTELPMLSRRVTTRVIYERRSLVEPDALDQVRRLASAGEQARVSGELPHKLAIADDRWALLPVSHGTELDDALLVRPSTLLDALVATFELLWARAVPLAGATEPAGADGRLVALLAAGFTDDAIARQLGVSPRTVQRRVSELMADLGARNRFQAGIQLASRTGRRLGPTEPGS